MKKNSVLNSLFFNIEIIIIFLKAHTFFKGFLTVMTRLLFMFIFGKCAKNRI